MKYFLSITQIAKQSSHHLGTTQKALGNNPSNEQPFLISDHPLSLIGGFIVHQLKNEGRTIVLTTHAMEDAEALCGRIAIIDLGQIVACNSPSALIAKLQLISMLKATVESVKP